MSYTYEVKIAGTVACSICSSAKPFTFIIHDKDYNKGDDFDDNVQNKIREVAGYFTCDSCGETCCKECTHDDNYSYTCKTCENQKDDIQELEDAYE